MDTNGQFGGQELCIISRGGGRMIAGCTVSECALNIYTFTIELEDSCTRNPLPENWVQWKRSNYFFYRNPLPIKDQGVLREWGKNAAFYPQKNNGWFNLNFKSTFQTSRWSTKQTLPWVTCAERFSSGAEGASKQRPQNKGGEGGVGFNPGSREDKHTWRHTCRPTC